MERYGIPGIVLMENASREVADAARRMLPAPAPATPVLILCGGGNNGGDGLAAARHLHNRGIPVQLGLTVDPTTYHGDALINWHIVDAMRLPCQAASPQFVASRRWSLVIDAIFGTGLTQPPREPFPLLAAAINQTGSPVLAVDLPSGLDCDTGEPLGACIHAAATITMAAAKLGFANPASKAWTGEVSVGDIGCPAEILRHLLQPVAEQP